MGRMVSELMSGHPVVALPIVALLVFVGVFLAVVARVVWRGAKAYDSVASVPLSDESPLPLHEEGSPSDRARLAQVGGAS